MKGKKMKMKKIVAAGLCLCLILLAACADPDSGKGKSDRDGDPGKKTTAQDGGHKNVPSGNTIDLMQGITAQTVSVAEEDPTATVAATDFGIRMLKGELKAGENTLISPASVLFALGMTANGARENTLAQFEKTFGMPMEELNAYLYAYRYSLPNEENCKVTAANSIWFKDIPSISVSEDFLQMNADYYAAGIYKAAFDEATKDAINQWVSENTDEMIGEILDNIPADAFMYLVNAMAFDARWQDPYETYQVHEGDFTKEDGTVQKVDFMYDSEYRFLEDENATGFLKYYQGGKYAFAALLPAEGVSLESYVASLSGEKLNRMFLNPTWVEVRTSLPKFEAEYSTELGETLCDMGLSDAFDMEKADFSGLATNADGNICINRVIHKTYISVDEDGTKAAAATAVEMKAESAMLEEPEYKVVYLDRPFVYFLIDCREGLPIFMGTVYSVE